MEQGYQSNKKPRPLCAPAREYVEQAQVLPQQQDGVDSRIRGHSVNPNEETTAKRKYLREYAAASDRILYTPTNPASLALTTATSNKKCVAERVARARPATQWWQNTSLKFKSRRLQLILDACQQSTYARVLSMQKKRPAGLVDMLLRIQRRHLRRVLNRLEVTLALAPSERSGWRR